MRGLNALQNETPPKTEFKMMIPAQLFLRNTADNSQTRRFVRYYPDRQKS